MFLRNIFFKFLIIFTFLSSAYSQDEEIELINIVAVVNDEAITLTDLINRLDLIIITSNLPNTNVTRENLADQVLQTLINEKLNYQEAKKLNINVSDSEIKKSINVIEKRNSLPENSLIQTLSENRISPGAIIEQVKAQITWEKIISKIIRPRIKVNENEISNEINIMNSNEEKNEYKYSEIFLNFDQSQKKQKIINTILKIREQLNTKNFSEIANQMSQSSSAKYGGLVNWTVESSVPKTILKTISNMDKDNISEPIVTNTGVFIIKLEDKRKFKLPDLTKSAVKIATLRFLISPNEENVESIIEENLREIQNTNSCEQLDEIKNNSSQKFGGFFGKVLLQSLPNKFKEELKKLKPQERSNLLYTPDGIFILMLCKQNYEANQEFALQELVKSKVQNRHFKMMSDRFILNLKRKSLIDIRM